MAEKREKKPRAAALRYDPEGAGVPILSAYGEGHVAERIVEAAKAHGVPVVENAPLASMLAGLGVGDAIPPRLYEVVAEILVFVGEMDRDYGEKIRRYTAGR